MRYCVRLLAILLLLLALPAWSNQLVLVLGNSSKPYEQFAGSLRDALPTPSWQITRLGIETPLQLPPGTDVVVAVGSEALRKVLALRGPHAVVATLLPKQAYERVLAENPGATRRMTAVFLDQPPARQITFLRHLLPDHKRIGMLFSGETRAQLPRYQAAASGQRGLRLDTEDVAPDQDWLAILNGLLPRVDVLLAQPDSEIFHRANIKPLLISTFRAQKPLVGFSEALVQAGALASLHATPNQIARQTASVVQAINGTLPPAAYALQFTVSINYSVAESLGYRLPDENALIKALLADGDSR